jgi:hypothetical protein
MHQRPMPAQGPVDVNVWRLRVMADKSDAALSKRAGYEKTDIRTALHSLITHGRVEVGYRRACGKTDQTHHMYREWAKLLKAAEESGMRIAVEPVKHGNAYATSKGGFWSSAIYTLPKTPNAGAEPREASASGNLLGRSQERKVRNETRKTEAITRE